MSVYRHLYVALPPRCFFFRITGNATTTHHHNRQHWHHVIKHEPKTDLILSVKNLLLLTIAARAAALLSAIYIYNIYWYYRYLRCLRAYIKQNAYRWKINIYFIRNGQLFLLTSFAPSLSVCVRMNVPMLMLSPIRLRQKRQSLDTTPYGKSLVSLLTF